MMNKYNNLKNFSGKEKEFGKNLIEIGEIFDSKKELRAILTGPKNTHREKLRIFKEKLARQQERLANVEVEIIDLINKDPDASFRTIEKKVNDLPSGLRLAEWQKKIARDIVSEYIERRDIMKSIRENYPNGIEIYNAAFAKWPKGKIDLVETPIAICLIIYDIEDYIRALNENFSNGNKISKSDIDSAYNHNGFFKSMDYPIADFNGLLVIINAGSDEHKENPELIKSCIKHEERHVWKYFFDNIFYDSQEAVIMNIEEILADNFKNTDSENIKYILREYFLLLRHDIDDNAGNEFLAFLKEGHNVEYIVDQLISPRKRGGVYDFFAEDREYIKNSFNKDIGLVNKGKRAVIRKMARKIIHEIFVTDYRKLVKEAGKIVNNLQMNGYSSDKIIAVLGKESMAKWSKIANRLMKAREDYL